MNRDCWFANKSNILLLVIKFDYRLLNSNVCCKAKLGVYILQSHFTIFIYIQDNIENFPNLAYKKFET